jgi:hypothetical protein
MIGAIVLPSAHVLLNTALALSLIYVLFLTFYLSSIASIISESMGTYYIDIADPIKIIAIRGDIQDY